MAKTMTGLIRLTRYREYVTTVVITSMLGFLATGVRLNVNMLPRMSLVLFANVLCVAFAFMLNDIEDANDDTKDKLKIIRNPVSAKYISPNIAYAASIATAAVSLTISYFVGYVPFLLCFSTIALGGLYSWKFIRLKSIPILDLLSHGLMLAGLQLLCAYYTLVPFTGFHASWILPLLFVVAISIRGQLFNQIRDIECDKKAGLRHTTVVIGLGSANILMSILLVIAGGILIYGLTTQIIPGWLLLISIPLGLIFLKDPISKYKTSQGLENTYNFQAPVLIISLISLFLLTLSRFF